MSTYGSLPEGWSEVELMSLASVITDGAHSSPKPQNQGRFMCSVKDMTYNKFDFFNVKLISEEDYQFLLKQGCAPQKGDLLISKDGANCLDLLFLYEQEEEIVLLSSIAIVRLKQSVCKEYVRYFLLSPDCQYIMRNNYVSGSAIPRVVLKDFKKVPIVLPPLPEQEAIASVLSSLDDKIDLLHRQNKTLEAMAETLLIQHVLPKEDMQDEDVHLLGDYLDTISVTHKFPNSQVVFLNTSDIYKGKVLTNELSDVKGLPGQAKKSIIKEDILFSEIRPANGRYALIDFDADDYVVSTKLMVLRAKQPKLLGLLYFYLTNRQTTDWLQVLAESRSGTFPQITFDQVADLEFRLPEGQALESLILLLDDILLKQGANHKQIQTLEKLRDTLLPKLMSGEVRAQYQTEEVA